MTVQTTKWNSDKEVSSSALEEAKGKWTATDMDYTLGSDGDASMLFLKFFNFKGGYMKPGSGFNFYFEITDDGAVRTDAWYYDANDYASSFEHEVKNDIHDISRAGESKFPVVKADS